MSDLARRSWRNVLVVVVVAANIAFGITLGIADAALADLAPDAAWSAAAWVAGIAVDIVLIVLMDRGVGWFQNRRRRRG